VTYRHRKIVSAKGSITGEVLVAFTSARQRDLDGIITKARALALLIRVLPSNKLASVARATRETIHAIRNSLKREEPEARVSATISNRFPLKLDLLSLCTIPSRFTFLSESAVRNFVESAVLLKYAWTKFRLVRAESDERGFLVSSAASLAKDPAIGISRVP